MYIFIILVAGCALYYYFVVGKHMQGKKEKTEQFRRDHPEAATVYLRTGLKDIYFAGTMAVFDVDDEEPIRFYEGMGLKEGLLLLPGKRVLNVSYGWSRPGIIHKTVTTQIAPSKQEVEPEAGKTYRLTYDRKENVYVFSEMTA